jgi:hypothetical protein
MKLIAGILFLTTIASLSEASESGKRNELFVFSGVCISGDDTRYETRFVPYNYNTGNGVQIIDLEDESRPVVWTGVHP